MRPYFTLDPNEQLSRSDYDGIASRLVLGHGADPKSLELEHLVQLAGTDNHSQPEQPFKARVTQVSGRLYSSAELLHAFPSPAGDGQNDRRCDLDRALGIIQPDEEQRIRSAAGWLSSSLERDSWKKREVFLELGVALYARTRGGEQGLSIWTDLQKLHFQRDSSHEAMSAEWAEFG